MCVVSMISDHYNDKWKERWPIPGYPTQPPTESTPPSIFINQPAEITRAEFEELKKEVQEMKELLKRAKKYDEENNEPDCEMDEKVALLKKIADFVGVDMSEIFKK